MLDIRGNDQIDSANFLKLAQLYTAITQHFDIEEVDGILKNAGNINHRFPACSCLTAHHPDLIGSTILHLAINFENFDLNIFELLLNYGADYTLKNQKGLTALLQAVETIFDESKNLWKYKSDLANKYISEILSRHISSENPANPCSIDGTSHFHVACMTNHQEAVSFFLHNGTPVDQAVSMSARYFPGYTALHFAVRFCAIETIEVLLHFHAKLDIQNARGMTPMHVALERKVEILDLINVGERILHKNLPENMQEYEKVMLLLMKNSTVGRKAFVDSIGLTHFHIACTMKDTSMTKEYLQRIDNIDHFVKLDSPVWPGYTALHFAALFNVKIVKLLLKNGANMNAKDANGISPFNICLEFYKLIDIHAVISSHPDWKDIVFSDGRTSVLDIIMHINNSDYRLWCENMNISIPFNSTLWPGYTPLHIVVVFADRIKYASNYKISNNYDYDNEEVGKPSKIFEPRLMIKDKYLAGGLNLTAQDAFGSTPIHLAFQLQKTRVVKTLTERNVMDSVNNQNLSHLHIAAAMDNTYLVTKLLKSGSDINLPVHNTFEHLKYSYNWEDLVSFVIPKGSTPLHIAAAGNCYKSISALLSYDAKVHAKDENGMTPIHRQIALRKHNMRYTNQMMLNLPELKDCIHESSNLSHLHVASLLGEEEAVKRLLDQGADVNAAVKCVDPSNKTLRFLAPYEGFTPLHFAWENGYSELCELLIERGANIFAESAGGVPLIYKELVSSWCSSFYTLFSALERNEDLRDQMLEDTGLTMLHLACYNLDYGFENFGRWNIMNDINARSNDDSPLWPGCTPLDVLMQRLDKYDDADEENGNHRDIEMVIKYGFVENGADVTLVNGNNTTALLELDRHNRAFKEKVIYERRSEDWNRPYDEYDDYSPVSKTIKVKCSWNKSARDADEKIPCSWDLYTLMNGHKDFNVNPRNSKGISHFHVACLNKYYEVVENFLKYNVDVNSAISLFSDEFPGCTPLHLTMIKRVDPKLTQLLLDHGADVGAQDVYGNTPLHFAAKNSNNNLEVFQMLIDKGASVIATNSFGDSPLNVALYANRNLHRTESYFSRSWNSNSDTDMVRFFLKQGYLVNSFNLVNQKGWIPEVLASCRSSNSYEEESSYSSDCCKEESLYDQILHAPDLLETHDFDRTPIHNISSYPSSPPEAIRLLKTLVKQGCRIDHQDAIGRSALHIAVQFGNVEIVSELLKLGADINLKDSNGKVPFNYCFEPSSFIALRRSFITPNYYRQKDFKKIKRIFVEHIWKLQLIELDVCKNNLVALDRLDKEIIVNISRFRQQLESSKRTKIKYSKSSFKLHDFLSETRIVASYPNMLQTKRQAIIKFFGSSHIDKVCENLDEVGGFLRLQFNKAVDRKNVIKDANKCLNVLAGIKLPYYISEMIIKLLSNMDLKNLNVSVREELLRSRRRSF